MSRPVDSVAQEASHALTWMAAARVGLWLCSVVGAAVCLHWAVQGLPGYWAAALFLGSYALWPLCREWVQRPAWRRTIHVTPFGVRLSSSLPFGAASLSMAWADLARVEIVSAGREGATPDLHFRLIGDEPHRTLEISADEAVRAGLCAAMEAYLGPLDEPGLLTAMAARRSICRTLWERGACARGHPSSAGADAVRLDPAY